MKISNHVLIAEKLSQLNLNFFRDNLLGNKFNYRKTKINGFKLNLKINCC